MKLIVTDKGDPSVGIYPMDWIIETPFNDDWKEETDQLEYFREVIKALYREFAEGRIEAEYDFELRNFKDHET